MNKDLFSTNKEKATAVNNAGGKAYSRDSYQALAQYVMTGMFQQTYYTNAKEQLSSIIELSGKVDDMFLAQLAVTARQEGYMKDTPALLMALLVSRNMPLAERVFSRVIDNGKMLRNFVQIIRSGVTGRTSLGSGPKRLVKSWFTNNSAQYIFRNSIGNEPSLADVIKMVHPKPENEHKKALYAYIIGRQYNFEALPRVVQEFEAFKKNPQNQLVPQVPFQLVSNHLSDRQWAEIAQNGSWHQTRMNLNTFKRHGVFDVHTNVNAVAHKLRDEDMIRKSKVFPYQLMTAYLYATDVPAEIRNSLQDAMEIATKNVPKIDGKVVVCNDVSGSMSWNVSDKSKANCTQIAGLFTSVILRSNPSARVMPFDTRVRSVDINPYDAILTNAKKLAMNGGGTTCSAPLVQLNSEQAKADLIVIVSDNESWADYHRSYGTGLRAEWKKFKGRNPNAKLVLIDITPGRTTQITDDKSVLNVGGFSDQVFNVINDFCQGESHWVERIRKTKV